MLQMMVTDIVASRERTVLEGLPLFLRENPSSLLKKRLETDAEDHYTNDYRLERIQIGIGKITWLLRHLCQKSQTLQLSWKSFYVKFYLADFIVFILHLLGICN
ncbi:hypothetical protein SRHO_G00239080 [Serrasalmus rhombeus]